MTILYRFEPEEIESTMRLIGETFKLGSHLTETGRGKRLLKEMLSDCSKTVAEDLVSSCKYVYSHGMNGPRDFTSEELIVLRHLMQYCLAL